MDQVRPTSLTVSPLVDGVRVLSFNRAQKANALDGETADLLLANLEQSEQEDCRAVVLRANGKAFCGGFDFTGYENASQGDLLLRFTRIEQLLQKLRRSSFISIALVDGAAMGAGADIVASCTFRIGTSAARFRFPGFRFGIALGTRHLVQLVGTQKARELLISNATIDAEPALKIGLLTHLVDAGSLQSAADGILASATGLDRHARHGILHLTSAQDDDANLAALVRSASMPGLHDRIARYRADHGAGSNAGKSKSV